MNDNQMIELAHSISGLEEYRRKELAILIMSTTLNPEAVEQLAGFMSGMADVKLKEESRYDA